MAASTARRRTRRPATGLPARLSQEQRREAGQRSSAGPASAVWSRHAAVSGPLTTQNVLQLQRLVGNRAVLRLMRVGQAGALPKRVQRKEVVEEEDAQPVAQDKKQEAGTQPAAGAQQAEGAKEDEGLGAKFTRKKRRFGPGASGFQFVGSSIQSIRTAIAIALNTAKALGFDLQEMVKELVVALAQTVGEKVLSGTALAIIKKILSVLGDVQSVINDVMPIVGGVVKSVVNFVGALLAIKSTKKRFGHFRALSKMKAQGGGDVQQVAAYGKRKVARSLVERIYATVEKIGGFLVGLADLGLDIAAAASFGATEIGKAATLTVTLGFSLVNVGKSGFRAVKGMVKAAKGTRAKARFEQAETLMGAAEGGDKDARQLIISLGAYSFTAQRARELKLGFKSLQTDLTVALSSGSEKPRNRLIGWVKGKLGKEGKAPDTDDAAGTKAAEQAAQSSAGGQTPPASAGGEEKLKSAFLEWGVNNIRRFYKWAMKHFKLSPAGFGELIKALLHELNPIRSQEQKEDHLEEEFRHYEGNKLWRKLMVAFLANQLRSD